MYVHLLFLNTTELSSRTDADRRGTLWYRVREIHTSMNDYIFSWISFDSKGRKTMQEIIPAEALTTQTYTTKILIYSSVSDKARFMN